jgi:hypothetical protein
MHEAIVSVDPTGYDLTEQVPYYPVRAWDDPIVPSGTTNRYKLVEVEIPEWLIIGIKRGQQDGRWEDMDPVLVAAKIMDETYNPLRILAVVKPTKFVRSLRSFFAERGYLTEKQLETIEFGMDFRRNRRRHTW